MSDDRKVKVTTVLQPAHPALATAEAVRLAQAAHQEALRLGLRAAVCGLAVQLYGD